MADISCRSCRSDSWNYRITETQVRQQQEHIVQEMIPAGMAQHMAEEPDVKQWVFQRTAIDAEQVLCGPAACPLPQEQSPQGEQKKGQDHRRIVLQLQC